MGSVCPMSELTEVQTEHGKKKCFSVENVCCYELSAIQHLKLRIL